jgi:tetratricopeptide (TPR) repeat protein
MKRFLISILLSLITLPVVCFGEDLQETRLNSGLRSTEAYSFLLIEKARENRSASSQLLKEAAKESPDLPAVYFELAKTNFSPSSSGIFESIQYIIEGIIAYSRNFWSAFTLTGSLFFSVTISFVIAIAIIVITRFPGDIRLFAHNVAEAKYLFFILVLLIAISIISPFLFFAGMLILLGIYMKKLDRIVVYLFLVSLVFSPLLFKTASLFLHTLSSSTMKAIVEVNESKDSKYALTTLKNNDDYASLFSYALALKREGHYEEAIAVYQRALQRRPDPKVYVNLGNCAVGMKNMEGALAWYLKAVEMKPLVSAYYNLSQISREMLDYTKGNEYFKRALAINRDAVTDYRLIYSRNPNRIVVDETLSYADLWGLAMVNTGHASTLGTSLLPASFLSGVAVLLIILYFFMLNGIRNKAYRCNRCSAILCPRCEKSLTRSKMCQACYASFIKLDELEAKERVAKLLSNYEHQKKRRNFMKSFSFLMPGVAQIYAGKILWGLFFLWPFLFFLFLPFTNTIFAREGLLFAHSFFTWAAIFFAALIYIISNIITRQRIAKGWL